MKLADPFSTDRLQRNKFLLLVLATGLIAIHLTLVSRANDGNLMGTSLLYWVAVGSLVWSKRQALGLKSDRMSMGVGALLIGFLLLKSAFLVGYDPFLRVFPVLAAIGLWLVTSGFRGFQHHWQEIVILGFLAPPPAALSEIIDTSPLTAQFSALVLWYLGFDVVRQGMNLILPNGGVEVYSGCSGVENMFHLLGLSVLFLILFPLSRVQQFLVPLVGILIAFCINGFRVALMAVLSTSADKTAFEYWHKGDGSLLFSMLSVLVFGLYCLWLLQQTDEQDELSELEGLETLEAGSLDRDPLEDAENLDDSLVP
ncbi:MAG: cyanoexosortase A [Elainella sp. Prado103]|nr:cyanoexosortase A [Elainella sp. Prado103]